MGTRSKQQKRVLMLGAGAIATPIVDYLCRDPAVCMTVGNRSLVDAVAMCHQHTNAEPKSIDASNEEDLRRWIADTDLVISVVPAPLHASVTPG